MEDIKQQIIKLMEIEKETIIKLIDMDLPKDELKKIIELSFQNLGNRLLKNKTKEG